MTVKGLADLLTTALVNAKAEGIPAALLLKARKELVNVDSLDLNVRRQSIERLNLALSKIETRPRLSVAWSTPLTELPWKPSAKLGLSLRAHQITTVGDALHLLPRAYQDRREVRTIAQIPPGEVGVILGEVKLAGPVRMGSGKRGFQAVVADSSGSLAVTYFQSGPWLKARFPLGKKILLAGEMKASTRGREMAHPEMFWAEEVEGVGIHFHRTVPIYPGFEKYEQRALRTLIFRLCKFCLPELEESLPPSVVQRMKLVGLREAFARVHFPASETEVSLCQDRQTPHHRRLMFEELFMLQLELARRRQGIKKERGFAFKVNGERLALARKLLPFELTPAQARVVKEIVQDMATPHPMHRLLQGDVGSGKTAVALIAAAVALQDGFQVALMAPTEILAQQHHRNFTAWLKPLGVAADLMSSGMTAKERRQIYSRVAEGGVSMVVGTHALIQSPVEFKKLGLVIIDEQHRFGVAQRQALMSKGMRPDVLVTTATPIPRTLAMTLYGDLDVSVIDAMPSGRQPIVTQVIAEGNRTQMYRRLDREFELKHQAYVIFPLIDESEKIDLADATRGAESYRNAFPNRSVGLLHGRLVSEEKERIMAEFRAGQIELLVGTTVVEVGVDVPNATVMVIENAERFGLSQLHQLRGRVGRGAAESFCYLLSRQAKSKAAYQRLKVLEKYQDGFVVAEKDLEIRGPCDLLGTRQSGLSELITTALTRDVALLPLARGEADRLIASDPELKEQQHQPLARALKERWGQKLSFFEVG